MSRTLENLFRTTLLACTLLFGLLVLSPQVLLAADVPDAVNAFSLEPSDLDDHDSGSGPDGGLAVLPASLPSFSTLLRLHASCTLTPASFEGGDPSLLPVTGLQPSAP
ncbi:MAG TPA: hypothetical protein VHL57_02070 [Flavobacteriales bacterium]|jgi:hypothetical protein|nr:hypothetical protein [Flavobacteriales bacterium]